jgi:hypothetical protein
MMFERETSTTTLAISNDGKTVACCGGYLTLHRMKDGAETAREDTLSRGVRCLLYAREGKWLLGWMETAVVVFDGETLERRRTAAYVYNERGGSPCPATAGCSRPWGRTTRSSSGASTSGSDRRPPGGRSSPFDVVAAASISWTPLPPLG